MIWGRGALLAWEADGERLRCAALRVGEGDLRKLRRAIATTDWRDLLVSAGFGDDVHAHERWTPRRLTAALTQRWTAGAGGKRFLVTQWSLYRDY